MTARVGFIGLGNMGSAILKGLAGQPGLSFTGYDLSTDKMEALRQECGMVPAASEADVLRQSDYVILAVKPQHMAHLLDSLTPVLRPHLCLISIAAGITMDKLRQLSSEHCPVVRVMPNTPALVRAGVFAVCLQDERLTQEQKDVVLSLFQPLGQVHVMEERLFDAFTAVVGCGPAYVCYFMEALIESAVALGLTRAQSTDMVLALFAGTVKMGVETGTHLSVLREMVTSPAGSTIQGLIHMDRTAVRGHIVDAVRRACERNVELGK